MTLAAFLIALALPAAGDERVTVTVSPD